jgi:outer membrane lipoprotein carrier protein
LDCRETAGRGRPPGGAAGKGWTRAMLETTFFFAFLAAATAAERIEDPRLRQVAAEMQRVYDATGDLSASFTQYYKARGRAAVKSAGRVQFKKPGRMNWRYETPTRRSFVADGDSLYIHDEKENQVMVQKGFRAGALPASIAFLWGEGDLAGEFRISWCTDPDFGRRGDRLLQLDPRRGAGMFRRIYFSVDPRTFRVVAVRLDDAVGNRNLFLFTDIAANQGISDELFRFEIPKGAEVLRGPER